MISRLPSIVAALAMAAGLPAVASAKPSVVVLAPDAVTRHVRYADLNLASATGERMLNDRVGSAVGNLCLEATGASEGMYNWSGILDCRYGAWRGARPQIARAVQRARDMAATGSSPIAAAAITVSVPR